MGHHFIYLGVSMSKIFLSYRRADSQANTDRIYERLIKAFDRKYVFKDVNDIPIGEDFPTYLNKQLATASIVLVMIGRDWATIEDDKGNKRLDKLNDFVRIEVETALNASHLTCIPVLVNGAQMPDPNLLPQSLRSLPRLNAIHVRNDPDFDNDMERLIDKLRDFGFKQGLPRGVLVGGLVALLIVIFGLVAFVTANGQSTSQFDRESDLPIPTRDPSTIINIQLMYTDENSLTLYAVDDSNIGFLDLIFDDTTIRPYHDFTILQNSGGMLNKGDCLRYIQGDIVPRLSRSCTETGTTDIPRQLEEIAWHHDGALVDSIIQWDGDDIVECPADLNRCPIEYTSVDRR